MNNQRIILLSGASGFIGRNLINFLVENNFKVRRLVRKKSKSAIDTFYWDPERGEIDLAAFDNIYAVINLCGENIFGRWTPNKKLSILQSRVNPARLLTETINSLKDKPKVFISASGLHFYGSNYINVSESSPNGSCFLGSVCKEWELATKSCSIRTINLRLAVVMDKSGGMLGKLLPVFKSGLGGITGDGSQILSWIALNDLNRIITFCLENNISGPINACSPAPLSNQNFVSLIAQKFKMPAIIPAPLFLFRLIFGNEFVKDILLNSQEAFPKKLQENGFSFKSPSFQEFINEI